MDFCWLVITQPPKISPFARRFQKKFPQTLCQSKSELFCFWLASSCQQWAEEV
jgi:hypothetical protein